MADGTQTQGTERIFDRETILDLTVNIIPLGIILFFVVLFLVFDPFSPDLVATVIMVGLHVIPFAALAVLTYFAGKVITEAERSGESETAETIAEATIGVGEGPADEDESDGNGDSRPAIEGGTNAGGDENESDPDTDEMTADAENVESDADDASDRDDMNDANGEERTDG